MIVNSAGSIFQRKDFGGIWKADYVSTGNITAPVDVFGISGVFISVKSGKLELFLNSDVYEKPLDAEDLTVEFKDNACTFTSEKDAEKDAASSDDASSDADDEEKTDTSVNGTLQMQEDDMVKMTINTGGSDMVFYLEKSDAVEMKAAKRAAEEEAEAAEEEAETEAETETEEATEKETKEETKEAAK